MALGEPTHGTLDPRRLQTEILRALARTDALVIFGEWCEAEGRALDDFVGGRSTGSQPPRIAGPVMWSATYDEAWVALREEHAGTGRVVVHGMRNCGPEDHEERLAELVGGPSGGWGAELAQQLRRARAADGSVADAAARAEAALEARALEPRVSAMARYQVRLWHQAVRQRTDPLFQSDRAMADNVIYVLEELEPRRRAAILAHDGHVARTELQLLPNGRRQPTASLGVLLDARFGDDYHVIGMLVGDGSFCAVPAGRRRDVATRRYRLRHPRGALERTLAAVAPSPWAVVLADLPQGTLPTTAFIGGYGYSWGWPWSWFRRLEYRETNPDHDFDALVYFPEARPDDLPGCDGRSSR